MRILYVLILFICLIACNSQSTQNEIEDGIVVEALPEKQQVEVNENGVVIRERFKAPAGFTRREYSKDSFSFYLSNLPLKPAGSVVKLFDGTSKYNTKAYEAVVDLSIGSKDLHQCADAVMRLRAEYLWKNKEYEKIHFNFTNGFRVDYTEWMIGKRIVVKGNHVKWVQSRPASNTYDDLWNYLEMVFTYAGTLSLDNELVTVALEEMQIGDVFIHGGSPGHAVIVVDMAFNEQSKEILFMLAQSYMPAQEIQILSNLKNETISPWYSTKVKNELQTSEWVFDINQLKRFAQD